MKKRAKRSESHQQKPNDEGADPERMTKAFCVFVA